MKSYEGMFLLKSDLTKEGLDKILGQVQDVIKKNQGEIEEIKEWGKKSLAYPVKKEKEGMYYLVNFSIAPDSISKIKKNFGLLDSILRVLIVK